MPLFFRIYKMNILKLTGNTTLNIVRQRTGADIVHKQCLYGSGIGIAVLDSGIYIHPDFIQGGNRIKAFRDFINHRELPYDDNGHGTHIAGIIAGNGCLSDGKYMGMAPKSHLIILKILDHKGNGTAETVCRAIEWTVKNQARFHIHIMNISIGAKAGEKSSESRMLTEAVEYAWDHGLIVVAAAGNNGPDPGSVTSPGTSKKIITVGASPENFYGLQQKSSCPFSGRGPTENCVCKPEILAPGFRIYSCGNTRTRLYAVRSGTSMAAPVVSGGIALILNKYPSMTNKEVKHCLLKSARPLNYPKSYQGWGFFHLPECLDGRCDSHYS